MGLSVTSTKINGFRLGGDADSVLSGFNFALLFMLAMVYFLMILIRAHEVFGCFFFGEQVCRPCVMAHDLYFILVHGHFTTVLLIAREKLRAGSRSEGGSIQNLGRIPCGLNWRVIIFA